MATNAGIPDIPITDEVAQPSPAQTTGAIYAGISRRPPASVRAAEIEKANQERFPPQAPPLNDYTVYLSSGTAIKGIKAHNVELSWRGADPPHGHMYYSLVEFRVNERDFTIVTLREDEVDIILPSNVEYTPKLKPERRLS